MKTGIELITEERQRQISKEGWTPEHDDSHVNAELSLAASVYACPQLLIPQSSQGLTYRQRVFHALWPFGMEWYKPALDNDGPQRVRELAKAGALIAAEIDRLNRKNSK